MTYRKDSEGVEHVLLKYDPGPRGGVKHWQESGVNVCLKQKLKTQHTKEKILERLEQRKLAKQKQ